MSFPDGVPGAPPPRIGRTPVHGTTLYTEVRGAGPVVLIIGAADEDAEFYRGVAERLADSATVVTYDRRGTRRSGREGWPGAGSAQHADDAAGLLRALDLEDATVLGSSAGAIVALRLALSHPDLVATSLCFEPGLFGMIPGGDEFRSRGGRAVDTWLAAHPEDWPGAAAALGRSVVATADAGPAGLFTPPPGREWFGVRGDENAESLLRGDFALTAELFDLEDVAESPVNLRFGYGTASLPIFRDITTVLAAARDTAPDALVGVGHGVFHHPEVAVDYIRRHLQ